MNFSILTNTDTRGIKLLKTAEYCFHFFGAKYKQYYIPICDISLGCSKLFDFLWACSLRKFNFCFNFCKNHIEISQASEKEKKRPKLTGWLCPCKHLIL